MPHIFHSHLDWSGAAKGPTLDVATFSRNLDVTIDTTTLPMSSAPAFRGDPARLNPEQLFVASVSACQALTYLFLAAKHRVAVVGYSDDAQGYLEVVEHRMRMSLVTLRPDIVLARDADEGKARDLVAEAHAHCFIANSVAAVVTIEPTVRVVELAAAG
jgi:organic hydroperoxide reductase OsmC/OhrA